MWLFGSPTTSRIFSFVIDLEQETMVNSISIPRVVSFLVGVSSLLQLADAAVECYLSSPRTIGENLTLQEVMNDEDGTYTMKLTYTGGRSWIGIGINSNKQSKMSPSRTVIGKIENGGSTSVGYYQMTSDSQNGFGILKSDFNTLKHATFVQTDTTSVLTFTQNLAEMRVFDDSMWIFAVGLPNNQWFGKHEIHGSLQFVLSENCATVPDPTPSPTMAPVPVTPAPSPSPTKRATPNPTITLITSSPTQRPITSSPTMVSTKIISTPFPSEAPVLPTNATESPTADFNNQTSTVSPTNYTITFPPTMSPTASTPAPSVAKTSTPTKAPVDTTISPTSSPVSEGIVTTGKDDLSSIFDVDNEESFSNSVVQDTSHPDKSLWIAHGIMLALAWGVCAPLGIGASLLKNVIDRRFANGPSWQLLHFRLNLMTFYLTFIGFVIGEIATWKEGKTHFRESSHHKAGLTIMILVLMQVAAGYFKLGLPRSPRGISSENSASNADVNTVKASNVDGKCEESATTDEEVADVDVSSDSASDITPDDQDNKSQSPSLDVSVDEIIESDALPDRFDAKSAWKWSHRVMGVLLIFLAWSTCHTGIKWQVKNWEDSLDWTTIFWYPTAMLSGSILMLAYMTK